MAVVSMKQLLETGAHFGHITQKWHPSMKKYIYGSKSGIYIIDLRKTLKSLKDAYDYVSSISSKGGKILFVGTKHQARNIIKEEAIRSKNFYANYRWLGGELTNFNTIHQSIIKLRKIEEQAGKDRSYIGIIKKEASKLEKKRRKMEEALGGIKDMRKMPAAIFVVDPRKEGISLREARHLNIPIIAIVDTNCKPETVDYVIPANDDSSHTIKLITSVISAASIEGRKIYDYQMKEAKEAKFAAKKSKVEHGETKSKHTDTGANIKAVTKKKTNTIAPAVSKTKVSNEKIPEKVMESKEVDVQKKSNEEVGKKKTAESEKQVAETKIKTTIEETKSTSSQTTA